MMKSLLFWFLTLYILGNLVGCTTQNEGVGNTTNKAPNSNVNEKNDNSEVDLSNLKSKLPEKIPNDIKMGYNTIRTRTGRYFDVEISGNKITFEERQDYKEEPDKSEFKISKKEMNELYQAFVKNAFDNIESKEKPMVADGGGTIVFIKTKDFEKKVVSSVDYDFKNKNHSERFKNVFEAIQTLVEKYKTKERK